VTNTYILLGIVEARLRFWTSELQAAFRGGNKERARASQHIIAEYKLLTDELMQQLRISTTQDPT
jgi:hypothetical protein